MHATRRNGSDLAIRDAEVLAQAFQRDVRRRSPGAIQSSYLFGFSFVEQTEYVTTDARHTGLGDIEGRGDSDGSILWKLISAKFFSLELKSSCEI
jgi:hypothetical protein